MPKENNGVKREMTPKPCKVFESAITLSSPEDIEYYKACIKEFEARNLLVGQIDDEGNYIINEDLRRELALMPKEQTDEGFNLIEAHAIIGNKDLFFTIEIDETDHELTKNLTASLYLTEKVEGYKNLQTLRTFVAKIVQPFNKNFTNTVKTVFNVQVSLNGSGIQDCPKLAKRMQTLSDDWISLNEIIDLTSQIYVMRMLQLLEQEGPLGQKILEQYYKTMRDEGLDKGAKAGRYLTLRKILDEIVEEHGGKERVFVNTKEDVKKLKQEFVEPIKKVEKFRQKQIIKDKKAEKEGDKKPEEKNVAAAKSSAKTSGKTAGKKDAKKPAKKAAKKPAKKADKKDDKKKSKGLKFGKVKVGDIKAEKPAVPAKVAGKAQPQKPIESEKKPVEKNPVKPNLSIDEEENIEDLFKECSTQSVSTFEKNYTEEAESKNPTELIGENTQKPVENTEDVEIEISVSSHIEENIDISYDEEINI